MCPVFGIAKRRAPRGKPGVPISGNAAICVSARSTRSLTIWAADGSSSAMRASVARYEVQARGSHSSGFARLSRPGGIDDPLRVPLHPFVRDRAPSSCVRFRQETFAYLPFAEVEAVAQDELESLRGGTAGGAPQPFRRVRPGGSWCQK